jgi:uncharacterized protein (DUF1697 family)
MTSFVALLRGVNVGGNKLVAMAELRDLLTGLGFVDPRTLLQSGNVVFRTEEESSAALEARLEAAALQELGLRTNFFVRNADEWSEIIAANPFHEAATHDPSHLLVMLFKDAPQSSAVEALRAAIKGPELIATVARRAYITYPDGIGRSRLTNTLIDAKLGTRGTGRNWNTVLKLNALLRA